MGNPVSTKIYAMVRCTLSLKQKTQNPNKIKKEPWEEPI